MSHPTIRHRHSGTRLGSEFVKRVAKGLVMDRRGSLDSKNAKKVKAPDGLARFFKVLEGREA